VKVSIVIPVYNQTEAYLVAALRSAIYQTVQCEIVVVDDGSDTPILPIVERTMKQAEYTNYRHRRQNNKGVAGALNAAIEVASGEVIQWLPSDDLFMRDKTERQMAKLDSGPVVYCGYEEGIPKPQNTYLAAAYPTQEKFFDQLKKHCFINAACVMWRREVFDDIGGFNPDIIHAQDYEFLLRCAENWNFGVVAEALVRRRVHAGQMINTLNSPEEAAKKKRDMKYLQERYGAIGNVWTPEGVTNAEQEGEADQRGGQVDQGGNPGDIPPSEEDVPPSSTDQRDDQPEIDAEALESTDDERVEASTTGEG
jgi:glycosyltransferase involved in cell wall biosynthesis